MKRVICLLVFTTVVSIGTKAQTIQPVSFINASGYYSLESKTTVENGETYGYFGTIKVEQIDSNRIYVDFYICKGAPNYNSGSFEDTLLYKNGIAARTTTANNSCIITFNFNTGGGVTVEEKTGNFNSGCGFGPEVVASGFYKKVVGQALNIKAGK